MTILGLHGPYIIGLAFCAAASPFWVMTWFRRQLHPDTYTIATTLYAILITAGCAFLLAYDAARGDVIGELEDVLIAAVACWTSGYYWAVWFRQHAEAVR